MKQHETIQYKEKGFDGENYIKMQEEAILEKVGKFDGRLYLEIGGKFLYDAHASRVLPGFDPQSKLRIFSELATKSDIIFCCSYGDIINDRQLTNEAKSYTTVCAEMIADIKAKIGITPFVVINKKAANLKGSIDEKQKKFNQTISELGCQIFERYLIDGYPTSTQKILSESGFGQDDYIPVQKNLVLVTGAASNSGKLSTCLGQLYFEHEKNVESGYAKYETFPIRNLPLNHPVNLAYEAATVDIGDFNVMDSYHKKAYGTDSVNYNRDVDAFELLYSITQNFIGAENHIRTYKSPTDMGINKAGFGIINDKICCEASIEEIKRRKTRYQQIIDRGDGEKIRLERCDEILQKALNFK